MPLVTPAFRIETQLEPTAADVPPIDHGLHTYNQRSADLDAIRWFACYAWSDGPKSLPVARLPAGGERHASSNRSGLMKRYAAAELARR